MGGLPERPALRPSWLCLHDTTHRKSKSNGFPRPLQRKFRTWWALNHPVLLGPAGRRVILGAAVRVTGAGVEGAGIPEKQCRAGCKGIEAGRNHLTPRASGVDCQFESREGMS